MLARQPLQARGEPAEQEVQLGMLKAQLSQVLVCVLRKTVVLSQTQRPGVGIASDWLRTRLLGQLVQTVGLLQSPQDEEQGLQEEVPASQ